MSIRLLTTSVLAASLFATPVTLTSAVAVPVPACSSELPEAMHRPGGFCDLRQATDTLAAPVNAGAPATVAPAAPPQSSPCGSTGIDFRKLFLRLPPGGRVLTAC